ncbi:MAG: hypothetical protein JST59_00835 [Actinobacteria bacterium]|nr:hypothetical protein [Actinomycetota bacterium]
MQAEQQLKLYSDSLQEKLHESEVAREQLLTSTRDIISNLKRDNQQLS